jgi:hypothetical protein
MSNASEGFDGQGGGLQVDVEGEAELSRVLVAENEALLGGGIAVSGTLLVANTTLAGNVALVGGGLYIGAGEANLTSVTVADNVVSAGEGEAPGAGGVHVAGGSATLAGSIVARNGEVPDCIGSVSSSGYNLDGDGTCGLDKTGDLSGESPGLRELADYGGLTMSLALFPGSPAVDAGNPAGCADDLDQRARPRVQDGDGDGNARCDIGAFEYNAGETIQENEIYLPSLRQRD